MKMKIDRISMKFALIMSKLLAIKEKVSDMRIREEIEEVMKIVKELAKELEEI